jgi:hypothetical protein
VLPSGPIGDTEAASSGHGISPRVQPMNTRTQRMIQPMPCVMPSTNFAVSSSPPIQTTSSAEKSSASNAE